jgi:maltooligosyltrehalose trehalohydrolase
MAGQTTQPQPAADVKRSGRRLPIGAEMADDGRVSFRVWAPAVHRLAVVLRGGDAVVDLHREDSGYFEGTAAARAGDRYAFRLDQSEKLYPDPASRYQPEGPHGPSQIVDPSAFPWSDRDWRGVSAEGQVIYELHVGTFTPEGTLSAAAGYLEELAALGVTVVEMMPVAEFEGRWGWGYDGVDLYAPFHGYGQPDDLRRFIDRAHAAGIGVLLDVVYNHLGPVGNYLRAFSPAYFTDRYVNEWGDAINFDGPDAAPVREFFITNAGYWIDEYHFDGLRLDATQQIFDQSDRHVIADIGERVRQAAAGRATLVVAENEPQHTELIRPVAEGGYGLDALWNDDFHHSAIVAATGRAEAYYSDTRGTAQELLSAVKYGYLFQGQYYHWQRQTRGTPALDIPPHRFVAYLENHDQVANSVHGRRLHQQISPARHRALTALLLLTPATPMLFQGQEYGSSRPFLYFADFEGELADAVKKGRAEFLSQFPSAARYLQESQPDSPSDERTFERSQLDQGERSRHQSIYDLHRDLLHIRRELGALRNVTRGRVDGAVIGPHAFIIRLFGDRGVREDDRVLVINLGEPLNADSLAEPLAAPPRACDWAVQWSSEASRYGGNGAVDILNDGQWCVPGDVAVLLRPASLRGSKRHAIVRRTA